MFHKSKLRKILVILFWILVWQLAALAVDNQVLLVTPWGTAARLLELLAETAFWNAVAGSLIRIAVGFLLGFFVAILLAGISLRYSLAEELLQPVMSLMKTIPVAAFVVLLLIWWGSSVLAVAISFLVVLPNIYINTLEGLKNADKSLLEMANVFRMSAKNRFLYIYRPALKPFLESSMKVSLGMCWKSGVAAEIIGTPEGSIGGQLYLSKIHLDTAGVLAWTVVVILLSVLFEKLILRMTEEFFQWTPVMGNEGRRRKRSEAFGEKSEMAITSIVLRNLTKSYGDKGVLSDVSTTYEPGQTYYLTSPSGSGKTTLLRLLCRLEQPDKGTIQGPDSYSMVFQEDRLCEDYNAIQNVAMVTGDEKGAEKALRRLLEEDALLKPCSQLSGGMKRRVALVRAMEAKSQVVLLDEPFTGMDAETKRAAEEYIHERLNGRILVIATHR